MHHRARTASLIMSLLLMLACASLARASADTLISAAADGHGWFVIQAGRDREAIHLCHVAIDVQGPYYRVQRVLTERPVALACAEDRVWIVFKPASGTNRREVFTLQVSRDATLGGYVTQPADRLDFAASLPGAGVLAGMVGTQRGPVALLVPRASGRSGPLSLTADDQAPHNLEKPMLLHLRRDTWEEIPLPDAFDPGRHVWLGASGAFHSLALVSYVPGDPQQTSLHLRTADGEWSSHAVAVDTRRIQSLTTVAGQLLAALLGESQQQQQIDLVLLRPNLAIPVSTVAMESGSRWAVLGFDDHARIVEHLVDGGLTLRTVDVLSGRVSSPAAMDVQPLSAARLWQASVLVVIMATGLLLLFLLKPASQAKVALPKELAPLAPGTRIIALLIDVVPAAAVTMLALDVPVRSLLIWPLFTPTFEGSMPYLLMAGLTVLHSSVAEAVSSRSLGKAMVGATVAKVDGSPAPTIALLMRGLLKLVVLCMPPLAIFAVVNPNWRSVHDVATGTIVVHAASKQPGSE